MQRRSILKYAARNEKSQGTAISFYCKICKETCETPEHNEKNEPICKNCQKPLIKRRQFEEAKCKVCKITYSQEDINSYLPSGLPQCPKCKQKLIIINETANVPSKLGNMRKFSTQIKVCKQCKNVVLMGNIPASNYLPDGRPFCGRCRNPLYDLTAESPKVKTEKSSEIKCPKCKSKYDINEAEGGKMICKVCNWRLDCEAELSMDLRCRPKCENLDTVSCKKCASVAVLSQHPRSLFLADGTPFCGGCKTPLKETVVKDASRKINPAYQRMKKVECATCYHKYDVSTLPEKFFSSDGSPKCPMCKDKHKFLPHFNMQRRSWNPKPGEIARCKHCRKIVLLCLIPPYSYSEDGLPLCFRCSRPLVDDDLNPLYETVDANSPEYAAILQECDRKERVESEEMKALPMQNIYCCLDDGFVTCVKCCATVDVKEAKRLRNGQPYCDNCKQPCFSVSDLPLTIQFLQNVNRFRELVLKESTNHYAKCAICSKTINILNLPLFCYLPNGEPICKHCSCKEPLKTEVTSKFSSETNETKAKLGNLYKCCYCNRTFGLDKLCKEHFTNTGIPKCIYCGEVLFKTPQKDLVDELLYAEEGKISRLPSLDARECDKSPDVVVNTRNILSDITPYTKCPRCQQLLFHKNHPIDHFTETGDLICTKCNYHINADTIGVDKGYSSLSAEHKQNGMKLQFFIRKQEEQECCDEVSGNIFKRFINSLNNYGYPEKTTDREYDATECYKPGLLGMKSPLIVNDVISEAANVMYSHQKISLRGKQDDEYEKNPWLLRPSNRTIDYSETSFRYFSPFIKSEGFSLPSSCKKEFCLTKPRKSVLHDRKILILVDDSEASKHSFKWFAYNMMNSHRDVVVLLMMVESRQYKRRNLEPPLLKQFGGKEVFQKCITEFKKISARYTKILDSQGVEYAVLHTATCLPEESLVNVVYNQNPDLLVLAYQPYCLKFPVYRYLPKYLRKCLATPVLFVNNEHITSVDIEQFLSLKKARKRKQSFRRKSFRHSINASEIDFLYG